MTDLEVISNHHRGFVSTWVLTIGEKVHISHVDPNTLDGCPQLPQFPASRHSGPLIHQNGSPQTPPLNPKSPCPNPQNPKRVFGSDP